VLEQLDEEVLASEVVVFFLLVRVFHLCQMEFNPRRFKIPGINLERRFSISVLGDSSGVGDSGWVRGSTSGGTKMGNKGEGGNGNGRGFCKFSKTSFRFSLRFLY